MSEHVGFIVHAFVQGVPGRNASRLAYLGRLQSGETFAAVFEPFLPHFYVRAGDAAAAAGLISAEPAETGWATMDGEPVVRFLSSSVSEQRRAAQALRSAHVRTYEADFTATDPLLMDRNVHGSVTISGESVAGRHVDRVFINPELGPAEWEAELEVLSIDIETNPETDEILAVGLANNGRWADRVREVHLVGADTAETWIHSHADEREMLQAAVADIAEIDPDIITGWNMVDFDFQVISRRLHHHGVPFAISRSDQPAAFLEASRDDEGRRQNASVSCHGRQVIDGLRLLRYGPQRFSDRKLDSVAHEVLGEGKTVTRETSRAKIDTLLALYRDDPVRFCDYCRNDAELVLRILDSTGLLVLTLKRCLLIGISLNRAWTSIPAFEFLYTEALHERGVVAPTAGVDPLPQGEAPGGAILTPRPGLWKDVLVFDFKSLYPSIIRTFNIDPLNYLGNESGYADGGEPPANREWITAPNGARFGRDPGILPSLLDRFWSSRDDAKARGDIVASFVYKIIMNSFYGVLGSPGCRFAGSPLAGAITGFGQYILHWTRDRLSERGHTVLYGDTDSLFVQLDDGGRTGEDGSAADLFERGEKVCAEINEQISAFISSAFDLESRLELEFEKVYRRFYLPRIRHPAGHGINDETRGRAKGYAGLELRRDGEAGEIDIKGMEAIRSDWTIAAGELQRDLLALLFQDAGPGEVEQRIRDALAALFSGKMDEKLVYSRRLRKPVSSYTQTSPPHVRAARLLPREEQEGHIEYVITMDGPQPISALSAQIDYGHYAEKQLRPIAEPICDILGIDTGAVFDQSGQLSLF